MTPEEFKRLCDVLATAGFVVVELDVDAFFARFDAAGPSHVVQGQLAQGPAHHRLLTS